MFRLFQKKKDFIEFCLPGDSIKKKFKVVKGRKQTNATFYCEDHVSFGEISLWDGQGTYTNNDKESYLIFPQDFWDGIKDIVGYREEK